MTGGEGIDGPLSPGSSPHDLVVVIRHGKGIDRIIFLTAAIENPRLGLNRQKV
jgi:hypothetical protein